MCKECFSSLKYLKDCVKSKFVFALARAALLLLTNRLNLNVDTDRVRDYLEIICIVQLHVINMPHCGTILI